MKAVDDLWIPFHKDILNVQNGDYSQANLAKLDAAQWNSGHDLFYDALTLASESLAHADGATCTTPVSFYEWEASIEKSDSAVEKAESILRHYFAQARGLNFSKFEEDKGHREYEELEEAVDHLIAGYTPDNIPAPPAQGIVDKAYIALDTWHTLRDMLEAKDAIAKIDTILANSAGVIGTLETLTKAYLHEAFLVNKDVRGAMIKTAVNQVVLMERMGKEAILLAMGKIAKSVLAGTIAAFEAGQVELFEGNGKCPCSSGKDEDDDHRRMS